VWRCLGPDRRLLISRLWSSNEAESYEDYAHVIVGTLAKLSICIGKPGYEWLRRAGVIVVDEAHSAVATSYTQFLEWCGLGRAHQRDEAVLIGLTATPFRGISEGETLRLVKRFDNRRLDEGMLGDDPYRRLQGMGIIAHVEHEVLEGARLELEEAEIRQVESFGQLPKSVGERLGLDRERNRRLVESIRRRAEDTTVLVFAGSVAHAQVLAAMLQYEDVPAAAVSGETDATVRRYYIERFRKGDLRVLTNFAVLTEGFDAPAVGAVYVARPTFSPNLYQQMIGRGLRGPLNGGKESCIIANVQDNLDMYGERLAFNDFEYLWQRG
jgi:superfamily II DNA or RNA helicase